MSRQGSYGLSGPRGNGGAVHAMVADRFAEQDARRREQLDRILAAAVPTSPAARKLSGCPECGGKTNHFAGCGLSPREKLKAALLAAGRCTDCGHATSIHRGIVCHGVDDSGARCRCDTGGSR